MHRRSGALVVRSYQAHQPRRVGLWAQELGQRHIRVRLLVLTLREYVAEDVQEGRWWVVHRPLRWRGQAARTAVAPDVKVQAIRVHPWASVGVLLSPRGVDQPQAGVPCAGAVEGVDQSVAPPGMVGGLMLTAAIVQVFISTLVAAVLHCREPRVIVVGEGVVQPVVPMPRCRVRHVLRCCSLAVRKHGTRDGMRGRDQEKSGARSASQPLENGKPRDAGTGPVTG